MLKTLVIIFHLSFQGAALESKLYVCDGNNNNDKEFLSNPDGYGQCTIQYDTSRMHNGLNLYGLHYGNVEYGEDEYGLRYQESDANFYYDRIHIPFEALKDTLNIHFDIQPQDLTKVSFVLSPPTNSRYFQSYTMSLRLSPYILFNTAVKKDSIEQPMEVIAYIARKGQKRIDMYMSKGTYGVDIYEHGFYVENGGKQKQTYMNRMVKYRVDGQKKIVYHGKDPYDSDNYEKGCRINFTASKSKVKCHPSKHYYKYKLDGSN